MKVLVVASNADQWRQGCAITRVFMERGVAESQVPTGAFEVLMERIDVYPLLPGRVERSHLRMMVERALAGILGLSLYTQGGSAEPLNWRARNVRVANLASRTMEVTCLYDPREEYWTRRWQGIEGSRTKRIK